MPENTPFSYLTIDPTAHVDYLPSFTMTPVDYAKYLKSEAGKRETAQRLFNQLNAEIQKQIKVEDIIKWIETTREPEISEAKDSSPDPDKLKPATEEENAYDKAKSEALDASEPASNERFPSLLDNLDTQDSHLSAAISELAGNTLRATLEQQNSFIAALSLLTDEETHQAIMTEDKYETMQANLAKGHGDLITRHKYVKEREALVLGYEIEAGKKEAKIKALKNRIAMNPNDSAGKKELEETQASYEALQAKIEKIRQSTKEQSEQVNRDEKILTSEMARNDAIARQNMLGLTTKEKEQQIAQKGLHKAILGDLKNSKKFKAVSERTDTTSANDIPQNNSPTQNAPQTEQPSTLVNAHAKSVSPLSAPKPSVFPGHGMNPDSFAIFNNKSEEIGFVKTDAKTGTALSQAKCSFGEEKQAAEAIVKSFIDAGMDPKKTVITLPSKSSNTFIDAMKNVAEENGFKFQDPRTAPQPKLTGKRKREEEYQASPASSYKRATNSLKN